MSGLSEINAKIRNICEKNLSVVMPTIQCWETFVLLTILAQNQIFLSEAKWDEIRK